MFSRLMRLAPWCLLLCCAPLLGQVDTARITGAVTDETGAVLPGVELTITNIQTNRTYTTLTGDLGEYTSVPLPVGEYRVSAELAGFKRFNRGGIILEIQETAVVNITMQLGEVTESIDVVADASLLNTTEPSQGQVIDNLRIVDMPLNGRDYIALALLSGGAVQGIGGRFGGFSAAGQRTTQNNYLLDGIDNNNAQIAAQGRQAETVKPSVDAIQEFKIVTNTSSAEYGRAAGGVVNVVMKSGTNDFNGTLYGFVRNDALDARNFFDGAEKPPFKRSQFGFSFGGPIVKNKTFFFGDYEGTRIRESRTVWSTIPTAKMQQGDFSEIDEVIYDPLTRDPETGEKQPFLGNIIPPDRWDPVAAKFAAWYPDPINSNLTQNYFLNPPNNEDVDRYDIRVDHHFRDEDNIYFRYSFHEAFEPISYSTPPPAYGGGGGTSSDFTHTGNNMALAWNHVFSPSFITSTRLGWNRMFTDRSSVESDNKNAVNGLAGVNQEFLGSPQLALTGYSRLGAGSHIPNLAASQTRQFSNDTSWMFDKHNLKVGVTIYWMQSYLTNPQQSMGAFTFRNYYTSLKGNGAVGGDAFADLLLGHPWRAQVSNTVWMDLRAPFYHMYIQDEWKIIPKLTLNIGMRYELNSQWVDIKDGLTNYDIDTDFNNPQLVVAKPGGSRTERALLETDKNNFAPRIGWAYQVTDSTVVRGGYGIFYANYEGTGGGQFMEGNPPWHIKSTITSSKAIPELSFREGIPYVLTPENAASLQFSSFERKPSHPYSQQWNLNIQREFGRDWMFEIGYYGATTNHLVHRIDANQPDPGPGNIDARRRWTSAIWPGTDIVVSPLTAIFRHQYDGNSNYNSLQTKVEKRFSAGFALMGSYMWGKTIGNTCGFAGSGNANNCGYRDPWGNRGWERALDNQHLEHRFAANYIWDLPFGTGRRWGADWGGFANTILGGWSLANIFTFTSGQPVSVADSKGQSNTGGTQRPDVVGTVNLDSEQRTLDRWFNTEAFAVAPQYTHGNAGRNIVIEPGYANMDLALFKRFNVTEDIDVQFRFEAFNFTNNANWGTPNLAFQNKSFGRITSAGRPRNLQFGLKIIF